MGAPLCVGAPQRWARRVVGVGLVSVSTVCLAAVCRVSSSAAPRGGLLWWCLGGGLGLGGSWEGAGHAGSGWLGGGGACVGLRFCPLLPPWPLPLPVPDSSLFAGLFGFVFFFWGGGAGWGAVLRCGCVPVSAPGSQGAGPGGADGGWLAAVVAWHLRGWLRLLVSVWVAWPGVGVRVGVSVAWADGVVGSVGVVGLCACRVCVRRRRSGLGLGTSADATGGGDAGDAYGGVL